MQGTAERQSTKELPDSTLVRVEANLEELPVFSAAKRGSRREEIVHWSRQGRDPETRKPIEQKVTLRPARGLGLPAERERDLYYLVIAPWLDEHGFGPEGRVGPIRYQDACEMLGWRRSGRSYELLREGINTLVSLHVEFENAIIDGETRKLLARGGGLFSEWVMYGEGQASDPQKRLTRGVFTLRAAPWFQTNWESNYRKPIDTAVYRALRTPVAKALYSYLDKRAWRRGGYADQVVEDLNELRDRFRLAAQPGRDLLKEFRRAHEDLQRAWPLLKEVRIEKVMPTRYRAVYVLSNQVRLPLEALPGAAEEAGEAQDPLVRDLVFRGINKDRAAQLVKKHDHERIRHHLDIHDQDIKRRTGADRIEKPGAWLYMRITENWEPFEGYRSPVVRDKAARARQTQLDEQRAREREIEAERAAWKALSPEQRATTRLDRWTALQGVLGKPLDEPERAALLEKYLQEEMKIS